MFELSTSHRLSGLLLLNLIGWQIIIEDEHSARAQNIRTGKFYNLFLVLTKWKVSYGDEIDKLFWETTNIQAALTLLF